jgi:hypothetical protein
MQKLLSRLGVMQYSEIKKRKESMYVQDIPLKHRPQQESLKAFPIQQTNPINDTLIAKL